MSLQTGALARPTLDPQPRTARPARAQVFNLPVTASTVLHQPAEATAWRWLKALLVGLWSCASLALVFLLWELLPRLGVVDPVWFPPLSKVLATWNQMWQSGELLDHIQGSLVRSLSGFSLAVLSAVPIGFLIGWFPPVRRFLNSALEFFRNTSALALLPVFILFLGIGEASKIGIVVFACFFPILLNTISGVAMTDPVLIKSARSLGFGPLGIFIRIVLPSAVPSIFTGFRLAAENAVLVLIAAEMVGATRGLGFLINYAQFNFLIPKMYAGILTIAVLGLTLNYLLVRGERHLSRWRVQPAQP